MRKSSAVMTFVVAASALTVAWRYADLEAAALNAPISIDGLPTDPGTAAPVDPSASPTATPTGTESGTAAPTESGTASPTASPSESSGGSGNTSGGKPKPTQTQTQAPAPVEVTKTSDTIDYKYGSIAMQVTMLGDKIVSASVTKGTTEYNNEWFKKWCNALVNGGSYGNVSGATYSFEAFKSAATNVFGKF